MNMSLLSEKFARLEAEYQADIEALRDASDLVNEADSVAEALKAAAPDVVASGVVTVSFGRVDVRILCWSPLHLVRQAIEKAGFTVFSTGDGTLCGDLCDVIKLHGISVPLMIERKQARVAA